MKLILWTITGAGANKIFVAPAPAPAPQKYLKRLRLQLRLLQNWLAPWLRAPAPAPAPQPWFAQIFIDIFPNHDLLALHGYKKELCLKFVRKMKKRSSL